MWFEELTGFKESTPEIVRENLLIRDEAIISKVNGRSYQYGRLEVPTLSELRQQAFPLQSFHSSIKVSETVGDVQLLHGDPNNENALFQAASQFNLLEMVGPHVTPELGVDRYEMDHTQGPACAIACGAGTIYRNYFVKVNGKLGQTRDNQIDCLKEIGQILHNSELLLWKMSNGYAMIGQDGLLNINAQLGKMSNEERETLKGSLKIGLQWDSEVTFNQSGQLVSQAYCSALPVAYNHTDPIYWENFSRVILEATYEATLHAAVINLRKTGCNKVYLTLVGGGAFGNEMDWILESLSVAFTKFKCVPLDVKLVSYGQSNPHVRELCANSL